MDKKNFIQLFVIHSRANAIESALMQAESSYKAIEERFKPKPKDDKAPEEDGYETAKGSWVQGEKLTWFEPIWTAWNTSINAGSRGGKKEAGDAFLSKIKTKEDARLCYRAAKYHAITERPKILSAGSTPPHFNLWCNAGRWDTHVSLDNVFEEGAPKQDSQEVAELKRKIAETDRIIDQFKGLIVGSSDPSQQNTVIEQATARKQKLTAELMQATRGPHE